MEAIATTVEVPQQEKEEEAVEAKPDAKNRAKRRSKSEAPPPVAKPPPVPQKLAIAQMPEGTDPEILEAIQQALNIVVQQFDLDSAVVRLNKPDLGGRPKKYATKEDEKAHYKEYFKEYYKQKLAKEGKCDHCGKTFATYTSVNRHLKRSKNCQKLRLMKQQLLETEEEPPEMHALPIPVCLDDDRITQAA
jgi:hypothetical protein